MIKYTQKMLDELKSMDVITYDMAKEFADKYDISLRSVLARISVMKVPYQPRENWVVSKATKESK